MVCYITLGKRRRRHKRAHKVRGPQTLKEQPLDHVEDQLNGLHEYTLVKERKPRSTPIKRRKKQGVRRRAGRRGVRRRMIIDIHLEVLDECQKGHLHYTKEDFFEILVQQFMKSEFMKEENVPKEEVHRGSVPKEEVQCSDSGNEFLGKMFLRKKFLSKRFQVQISGLGKEDFILTEDIPEEGVPKEQIPSSYSGIRV
ncbi:SICA antigen [Plasmodium coatneyi]|uniref:SICA antigen n=1 Tax=Plasmodium coatneyi TaxID=208452 RepID=A0A1B1DSS3_9APIC|nr:SICA antigen [Plasmodium coatneyi]ANQ05846.1 SICA antigen [Plasmodium coatneyi]